jgi:glutamyl-tRNA(Gln) amidotransferase subunit E
VGATERDAVVLVWGPKPDAECGCREIEIRAKEGIEGVPNETRQALADGTNGFERILPGPDRMYPDTDLPPLALTVEQVDVARGRMPEPPWSRLSRYEAMGLPEHMLDELSYSTRAPLFDRLTGDIGADPMAAAVFLTQHAKALGGLERLADDEIEEMFTRFAAGRMPREGLVEVARCILDKRKHSALSREEDQEAAAVIDGAIKLLGLVPMSKADVVGIIDELTAPGELPDDLETEEKAHRYLMGVLMKKVRGRVAGRLVAELVNEKLSRVG